jgi:hypothetical protein
MQVMIIKIILFQLLLIISNSVFAEWSEISRPSSNRYISYIDYKSIKKEKSNMITFWTLTDWKSIREVSGDKYLSNLQHIKVDCKKEKMWLLDFIWYSENMGLGKLVFSKTNIKNEPTPVAPMTDDAIIFNKVCSKK